MFLQANQPFLQRQVKTSQPRFKRLPPFNSPDQKITTASNLRPNHKPSTLDNSKQNLCFESHLTKIKSACKIDETSIVSKYLRTIRKDYDDLNKISRKEMNNIKLKRRQIELIKRKNQVLFEKREELEQKIVDKEKQTNAVRAKEEDTKMQTKTLENIIVRMKKDQIFYKQFGRIKDQQLKKKIKQVKLMEQKIIHQEQKLHKLSLNLQNCKEVYEKNKQIREKKFQDFSGKISDVRQRDRFLQQRKERTYELQSIELNDTLDDKNVHMRQITLAHKVADSLLESKVNTLIKKNADIQGAFHIVKIKTGVSQPHFLTSKFFSYEQTSEALLSSISQNQTYIEYLKQKKQQLTDEHRQMMNQQLLLSDDSINTPLMQEQQLQKERLIKETNRNHLLVNSIKNWIGRVSKEIKTQTSKSANFDEKFIHICQNVQEQLKKNQNFNWAEHKIPTAGVYLKKMVRQQSAQELSSHLRQSQDMNESNLIEEEYIKNSRQVIQKKAFTIKHIKKESKPAE